MDDMYSYQKKLEVQAAQVISTYIPHITFVCIKVCVFVNLGLGCQSLSWESCFFFSRGTEEEQTGEQDGIPMDLLLPVSTGKLLRSYTVHVPAKCHPL